jgi:hypothetical protein
VTAVRSSRVITRRSSGYVPAAWVRRLGQLACSGRMLPRLQRAGFEEGPDAGDGDADRVIAADRDAARLGGAARDGCPGRSDPGDRAAPLPPPALARVRIPRCRHRRPRNHATCVMACHAGRREARSQQPPGKGSKFNAIGRRGPMREDGGLTGYGMATAVDVVPALERSHARPPAALWAQSCLRPGALSRRRSPRSCADRSPAGAAARGEDPLNQEGSPVQVPVTVQSPAGRFTGCVVRT